jgi:hypothetical protein
VVDAPPNPPDCTQNSPDTACSIVNTTDTYALNFVDASQPGCQAANNATGVQLGDLAGFTYCVILNNLSNSPLTTFNFTFTVPPQGLNDDYTTLDCSGIPTSVSSTFCPSASVTAPLVGGALLSASFSANPGVPNGEDAYLFIDFANSPGTTSLTLTPLRPLRVPEPGELGLFGLGLLAIGAACGLRMRREHPGMNGTR